MSAKDSLLKLLNLDGVIDQQSTAKRPKKANAARRANQPESEPQPVSPWVQAAQGRTPATAAPDVPWQVERPNTDRRWYWKLLRTLLVVALILVILTGIRTMFFPPAIVKDSGTSTAAPFPDADARGVAERYAESYLSWNAENPAARNAALALDMPALGKDDKSGWDGKGRQTASGARALSVDAEDSTHAVVTVVLQVVAFGEDGTAKPAAWTALAVPVELSQGRVIVTGNPGTVGIPAPKAGEKVTAATTDSAVTADTKDYATTFFTAYGSDVDVDALTAPEAGIAGLGGLYTFDALKDWAVYQGDDDERTARAVVRWVSSGGAALEQVYSVHLVKVTAGNTSRWQIESITGSGH